MMRPDIPRTSTAIALVASIVAVVALMFPGVGFGQTTSSHGGSPSDVYSQSNPEDSCARLSFHGQTAMEQTFTLDAESNVLVYFSFEVGLPDPREEAEISFGLDGISPPPEPEWGVAGPASTNVKRFGTRQSSTLMWTFDHVASGDHRVEAFARVGGPASIPNPTADLNGCALTVIVIPVAESA